MNQLMDCYLAGAVGSSCSLNSQQGKSVLTELSAGETRLAWYQLSLLKAIPGSVPYLLCNFGLWMCISKLKLSMDRKRHF